MKKNCFVLVSAMLSCLLLFQVNVFAKQDKLKLRIIAQNDMPGPVQIKITSHSVMGKKIFQRTLTWSRNDNRYSIKSIWIPARTKILKFTFINDTPGNIKAINADRNAFIDYFTIDKQHFEAEDFDKTGGPHPRFAGCKSRRLPGRTVADCGHQGDYVEYQLSDK